MTNLPALIDDDPLQNPLKGLLEDMRANPADAAALVKWDSAQTVVAEFERVGYTIQRKIDTLMEIYNKGTFTQRLQAMDRLDAMKGDAMARVKLMAGLGGVSALGSVDPIGLPQSRQVQSVEMTSKKVRMVIGDVPDETEHAAPPARQLEISHVQEGDEDDDYHPDTRDECTNICRPPTGNFGRAR